ELVALHWAGALDEALLSEAAQVRGEAMATYGAHDTSAFRRVLAGRLATDPRIDRYWDLTAEVISDPGGRPEPTPGSAHDWLLAALDTQLGTPAGRNGALGVAPGEGPDVPDRARAVSPR
ncbi:hypothetical protein ABT141_36905, partial [Streptomyces anulatus]